jgi:hypothetical protein
MSYDMPNQCADGLSMTNQPSSWVGNPSAALFILTDHEKVEILPIISTF